MANKASDKPSAPAEEALKRQKKQARQEAKLMLEIEEAKKKLKNAQKKQSKAQARVEARSTSVQSLEARLTELRTPSLEPEIETPPQSAEIEHQQEQSETGTSTSMNEEQAPSIVEESSPSEIMVVTERENAQDNGIASETEPAPTATTPRKAPARKTTTTRKPAAPRRPVNNTRSSKQPPSDAE
jgi:hypothetical protein